jgi:N-acetyl sugar amidotransferase
MTKNIYQQCKRCVMDTSDPGITFDEHGYCNHCNDYYKRISKQTYQGKSSDDALAQIVEKIKKNGKNKAYDCVLGISGGVDSCYTAVLLKQLGLRVLAVHLDNGWNSETAVKNIKNVVSKLGIDYQSYVLDWEEFKDLQLAFLRASVPEAETPTDIAIQAALHKVAADNAIKYNISGGNNSTEGILPKSWHYNPKDSTYINAIHKQFGTVKLKTFPTFGYRKEIFYKFVKGIKIIYLLNYVNFSKKDAQALLEQDYGWRYYGGKHYESKYTGFLQSYILPEKFNIDYRRATFSSQICTGEITREEALAELTKKPYDPAKVEVEKIYVCKKLGISVNEFNEIMAAPPKTYKDYPNDEKLLEFIYKMYRKFY